MINSQSKSNIPSPVERVKSQKPRPKMRMSRVDIILERAGGNMEDAEKLAKEKDKLDYQLMLAWNFSSEIMKRCRKVGYKGKFITPVPKPRICE